MKTQIELIETISDNPTLLPMVGITEHTAAGHYKHMASNTPVALLKPG